VSPVPARPARPPLPAARLRREVVRPGGLWRALELLDETGSTNADVADAARAGAPEGLVLVAEHQRAGRGRAGRQWSSPPRAGLAVSVLLRPGEPGHGGPAVPPARWSWLSPLAGVALVESVTGVTGLAPTLKWPNDLLVDERKCAGVLAEVVGEAVVLGVGLNVTLGADELPAPSPAGLPATSLALAGARTADRAALLVALLRRLAERYLSWRATGGDPDGCGLRAAYLRSCATVGRRVRVLLPGGGELVGEAETVDLEGRLVLRTADGTRTLAAGDIIHLRPG
jgi:BirA family biotin operon repressor/biotin-[acetyl-CoA-carboxylase] ligase